MRYKYILFLSLFYLGLNSQDYSSPVQHEIKLAGTFGELRSDHFHMGIDIKSSNGKSGDAIFAVADGWISRLKVSRSGYGNVIYIDHHDGHTTVYGHLSSFAKKIDDIVNHIQYEEKSFEIDTSFTEGKIKVSQGEVIGKMGNSGSSYGPHLHFEIRNTISESPLNPLKFGLKPFDNVPPKIQAVKIYGLDDQHQEIFDTLLVPTQKGQGKYELVDQKIGAWRIGIAIKTYDPMNGGYNKNGIYSIKLLEDDSLRYSFEFDSISFDDTKYINAHIDYPHYISEKSRFHRCYKLAGNHLPLYDEDRSIIKLFEEKRKEVKIIVEDFEGNQSTLDFQISRSNIMQTPKPRIYNYHLPFDQPNIISYNGLEIFFPVGAFYQNEFLFLSSSNGNELSPVYHIGSRETPLHKNFKIHFKTQAVDPALEDKMCLVECSSPKKYISYGGKREGEYFISEVGRFGNFQLMVDTIPPSISLLSDNFSSTIQIKIEDNFETSGRAKGLSYDATIDGQWAKFEYDLKRDRLIYRFDESPANKEHQLELRVTDDRGNSSLLTKNFRR